jgi:hypothetical protein
MADLTFGLGIAGLFVLAIILLGVAYFGKKMVGAQASKWMMAIGLIALLFSAVSYVGIPLADDDTTIVESAAWDITVSESENETYAYALQHRVMVAVSFNDTSDAFVSNTGVFTLNFTALRADVLLTDAICRAQIGSVPTVDVAGSADEYILDKNTDGSFNVLFTKLGGVTSYESANVLVEAGSSGWVSVQFTLNADAVAEMSQYESCDLTFTIGGETWTIVIQKAIVTA